MKNKRLDNWKRKESISARRKSKVLSLPIAILFIAALLMAILFQFPNLLDGGITGAVTGLEILPSEENIGLNLTINDSIIVIDENITLNEINTTLNETNITLIIEPIVEEVSVPENSLVMPEESIIIPPENLSKQSLVLNEVVLNVSDSGSYQIQEDANPEKCGTVNSDLTLIVDLGLLDSYPICFLINASNIILDGNGHTITGDGASGGYGVVFLTDSDNVTIKNFAGINNFQRAVAVFPSIDTSGNITIYNNTINQNGSGLSGIAVDSISGVNLSENIVNMSRNSSKAISVSNSTNVSVVNNNLTNYGNVSEGQYISRGDGTTHTGANGISISNDCTDVIVMDNQIETFGLGDGILISGQRNLVQNNTIITRGADGYGVNLYQAGNTTILNQHITTFNNSGMGISIDSSGNNTINANHISTVLETSYGIELFQIAENNILLNNNISSTNAHEIEDTTGNSYINYLVYNNSFGEIRWINETNDGFLKNITLNGTLSLDTNLFIGDNVIALNASAFSIGAINTSANITIFGLAYTNANVVKKVDNYTTSSNDVLTHGVDCIGSSCEEISYDSSTGTLLFNVTSFSSFAADSVNTPPVIDTVVLNATDNPTNYTTANLTLYWNATDADLDNVKNITDWRLNGTSIATLNMPFENNSGSSFAIDYSTYSNNGTVDGAVWNATGGRDGKGAYEFTNDSIDLSVELFSDYTSNPSYSAFMWIKAESNGSLISQYSSDQGFTFQIITSKLRYWKADNPIAISTTDVDDVQWHHVGFTKGLTGAVALYVDGVIDGTGTDNQDPENSNVRIGEAFSGEDGYSGSIDDVLVFNHSLSPEQVLNLFNNLTYLLDANETSPADVWSACVTGNDGTNDSIEACSNSLTIETIPNNAPTVTTPVIYPLISYTNDTLNASTYYNDTDSDAGTVYFQWFVNDINVYNETNSSVTAGSNASTSLDQNNFTKGDLVNVTVYANDGTDDSASSASTILTISNLIIEVSNVVLNATDNPTNSTNANLTLYWETIDTDGDGKNITDWRLNKSSIAVLNMPFENISDSVFNATKDYSTFNNNGSEHGGVLWNATGGYDGKGSYEFDGVDDYISIPDDSSLEAMEGISIVLWVKPTGTGDANQRIVDKTYNGVYALYYTSPNLGFALVTDTASANDATCGVLTNNIWNHVVATWSSSSGKYECYINSIASGGGAPLAGNRVSNDANDLKIGTGAGSDFNGTIDDLMILNRSLTDEQIINLYNNKTNLLDANETLLYDTWQTCVTGNDGLSESAEICSNNLTIASNNNAPTVTTPVIYPLISYTNDTLNASTAYTDGDSDVGTVYFQWFVNDINVYNETNSSVTAGSNASTSLDPNNFTKGDLVNVTVYANDGTDDSAVSASTILTISNLAPEVITPVIYSLISYTNDTLNASTAYTDGDSEAGTVYFQWFVNDINVYNETNASVTAGSNASTSLDPNNFTKGDLVNVTVYANDGTDDSAVSASTILIISNLAPEVITPVIYPTTAYTNDTLNASTYYNDTDSDAGTVYFQWFVNDINVYNETNSSVTAGSNASTSLDPNNFSKGDQVNVTVYANDGTDDSETNVSTILTISNLGPDVSNVVLNATDKPSNTTAANLTLYWDVSDVDGDTSFTNITDWRLNGSSIAVLNMPIENNSATPSSTLIDYSILSNNATGGNGEFNLTAGRDGFGAMEFNGGNFFNLLSGSYTDYNGTDEFSVSIWVNMTEGDKTGNLETLIGAGFSNGWFVTLNESRPNFLLIDGDSNAWDCQSDTRVNDSTWHYLTYINNASGRSIFIDGTLDISCSDGPYRFATGGTSPRIGMKFGGSNAYTGTMDDLIIFNTSLSVGQILVLNSSTNNLLDSSLTSVDDTWQACVTSNDRFEDGTEVCSDNLTIIIFSDTTNPSVDAVNSPTARTNFTTGDIIVFNASVSDDVGVTSVLFQISNGSNPGNLTGSSTNSSLFNASLTVSSDSIVDGNHTLIVFASDAEGNIGTNSTVTFLVDTTSPETVELYNLTEGLNLTKNIPTFSFQVNDTWTTTLNCALVIDDEVNVSSISSANGTTINQLASRSIVDGFHNWSVNCNDSVNLNSNSITNNFTIDTSPPLVGPINNPIDRTNFTTGDNIVFNVTAINGSTESGVNVTDIHSVLFQFRFHNGTLRNETTSSTNDTLFNMTLSASSLLDGNHTLFVYANDTAGNENDTFNTDINITFLVDTTSPETVELYNLTEGLNLTKNIPTFSFQVNDTLTEVLLCDVIIDDEINVSAISTANGTTINQLASRSIVDGFHNWSVNCNDSVNLNSNSITNNFTIDTAPPLVGPINNPIDRTNFTTGDNIVFNVTAINGSTESGVNVTDIHSVLFQFRFHNGTLRNETTSSTNDTLFNMTLSASSLLDGNHTLFVYANDTAGNENDTFDTDVNVSFLVDTTNPETVELYNLTGGKIITDTIPTFEWQVNDTWTTTLICDLIVDDSINTAGISSTNGTTTDYTLLAAISSGNHNWSISCNDSVNLNSNSMTHNFTISTGAPSINAINSPITRTNFTTGDIIVFNASVSDDIAVTSVLFQISNGSNLGNLTGSSTNASLFNASLTVSSESIVDGNHTLTVFASDGSNLSSDATVNFLVDTTTPDTVELYNLTNNRSILDTTPTFEWQVNDTWATTLTCDLIVDDSINTADISSINGTTTDYTIPIAIALGDHNWSVSCNDSVLLNNLSITQNFTINQSDITPPILIGSATLITSSTAQLVVTTNEEATCKYDSGEMSYAEMRYIMDGSGTLSHSHSVTGLSSSRAYVYYVRCQDALGNSNPSSTQIAFTTSAGAGAGSGGSGGGSAVVEESTSEDSIIDGSLLKTATAGDVITLLGAGKVTVDVMTAAEITYEASSSESISTAEKITFTITNNGDTIVNLYPELKEELISPEYIDEFEDNLRKWSSELGEPLTEEQIDLYKLIEQKNVQPIFTEKTFSLDNLFKPGEVPVENVGEQVISTTPIVTFTEVPIYYLNDGDQTITLTPELKGEEIVLENQAEMESALNLRISEEHPELSRDEQEKLLQEIINSIKITGDVQPILTEKTFGFFESNEDIVHTGQQITGKLLESSLEDCGEVVLKPGEIFEKTCTVRRRITANPTSTQIVFKSENKKVLEKDVDPQEGAIGAAVDVDLQKNLIELYMLIPKVGGSDKFNDYSLEFMIDDKLVDTINGDTNLKYLFAELFGPFLVREDKGFVFAQQFKYKPEVYYGNKLIQTRVIKNGEVVAQHEFNVYFGEQEGQMKLAIFEDGMSSIIFGFVLFTIVVVLLGLITIAGNYGEDLNGKRRTKSRFFKFVFFIAVILLSGSLLLGLDNEHQIKNTVPGLNQNEISQVTSDNTQLTGNTGLISQTENLKEDSWLSSGITYTGQHVKGKLLESYLEDCGELFVKPGEKVEKTCTLRKGLSANPVPRKIVFKSAGEDVLEKDIAEQDSGMGVTIDLFKDEKLLELYMLIPAIDGLEKFNDYFLEFTVSNEENSNPIFAEVYGPYSVREDKGFIFAQQLKYNPEIYAGQKQIQMKLFKENKIIAQQEFAMDFGGEESVSNLRFWDRINTRLVLTALLMFIFIPAVMIMYFIKKRRKFEYF